MSANGATEAFIRALTSMRSTCLKVSPSRGQKKRCTILTKSNITIVIKDHGINIQIHCVITLGMTDGALRGKLPVRPLLKIKPIPLFR